MLMWALNYLSTSIAQSTGFPIGAEGTGFKTQFVGGIF